MSADTPATIREPVLVTGATGFIGSHLVARLAETGRSVRALVLPGDQIPSRWRAKVCSADQPAGVEVFRGDVADRSSVAAAMESVGTVVHLAAIVTDWGAEALHHRVTVEGTHNVLSRAAEEGARAVLVSSIVVYGNGLRQSACPEDRPFGAPLGPYSRSKQAQERLARALEKESDLDLVIVRPANVFGPGSTPWVEELVHLLRKGGITLIGGGDFNAGLCHVDNLVDLLLLAAAREDARGGVFNVTDGSEVTWRQYVSDLARLAGTRPPRSAPWILARPLATLCEQLWKWKLKSFARRPPITREAINLVGANHRLPIERARQELGYQPRVDYSRALAELAESLPR